MGLKINLPKKRGARSQTIGVALTEDEVVQPDVRRGGEHSRSEAVRAALQAAGLIGDEETDDGEEQATAEDVRDR